jgi:hypothetical protein
MTGETAKISFTTKNWHIVEASTFFVFLIFAPMSLSDRADQKLFNEEIRNMIESQCAPSTIRHAVDST